MNDKAKTREQLIGELAQARQRITELEMATTGPDMTKRMLQESEEKYRLLFDNNDMPVTYLTTDGYILLINKVGAKNLGGKPGDFAGKPLNQVLPQIADLTMERIGRVMETGSGEIFDDLIRLPRGDRWFLSSFQPIRDTDGQIFAIQIVSPDNTERKLAEEALKESEQRFRNLSEAAEEGISIHDNGTIVEANEALAKIFGYQHSELIGMQIEKLAIAESRKTILNHICSESDNSGEVIGSRKDGSTFICNITNKPYHYQEKLLSVGVFRDITERKMAEEQLKRYQENLEDMVIERTDELTTANKQLQEEIAEREKTEGLLRQSEEQFRTIFENANDEIAYLDESGILIDVNRKVADIFGYTREEIVGKNFAEFAFLEPEAMQNMVSLYDETVTGSNPPKLTTFEANRKDGSRVFVEVNTTLIENDDKTRGSLVIIRDVTERKKAEEALQQSEEKFRSLIENVSDIIMVLNADGDIQYASPSAERLYGYKLTKLIGQNAFKFVHPDEVSYAKHIFSQGIRIPGYTTSLELRIRHKDSSFRHIEVTGKNLLDYPMVGGVVLNFRDITERKQAEDDLKESERQYRLLADNVTDVIWIMDMNLKITYVSPSITNLQGYSIEEAKNRSLEEDLTPASYELAVQILAEELAIESSADKDLSRTRTIELELNCKDGSTIWAEVKVAFLRDQNGQPVGIIGVTRDISERKRIEQALQESENKYRNIFENIQDVYYRADMEGKLVMASPSGAILLGYASIEEMLGTDIAQSFYAIPQNRSAFLSALSEKGKVDNYEIVLKRKDGTSVTTLTSSHFFYDENGEPIGVEGILTDITDRKQAEESLKQSEEKYRSLIENINDAVFSLDINGFFTYASPVIERIWGYKVADVIGCHFTDLVFPEDLPGLIESFERTLNGQIEPFEFRIVDEEERMHHIHASSRLLIQDGQPTGITGVVTDITARKQAEEALRESEEKYRLVTENANELIAMVDMKGDYIYANEAHRRIAGYDPQELLGRNALGFLHPEDYQIALEAFKSKSELREVDLETRYKCTDGTFKWIHSHNRMLLDENGFPERGLMIGGDITERKLAEDALRESEERWRSLAENAPNLIISTDPVGTILYVNQTVLGLQRKDAIGKTIYDFADQEYQELVKENIEHVLHTGEPAKYETIGLGQGGQRTWYETHAGPVKWDNKIIALIFISTDITERKLQQEQILQHNRELAALNTISKTVNQSLDLDGIMENALNKILEILEIKHIFIALTDEKNEYVNLKLYKGISGHRLGKYKRWKVGEGILGQVAQSGDSMFIESLQESIMAMWERVPKFVIEDELKSAMYVPLKARGRTLGIMTAITEGKRIFTPTERDLLITIGNQISTAIENAVLYEDLQDEEEIRREGLREAILAQEEERRRIARELHDQTSQVLTGASAMLEASIASLPRGFTEIKERLKETRLSLTNMLLDVRNIIYELRPTMLDDLGLVAAARWQTEEFLGKAGVEANFEISGRKKKLPVQTETALFRIIQEATTNIIRHAQAKSARIKLGFEKDSVKLSIEDNGKGFEFQETKNPKDGRRGLGLLSMKERTEILNGAFILESQSGTGTRITISIPIR